MFDETNEHGYRHREDLAKISSVFEEHFFNAAPSKFIPKLVFHIGRDTTYSDESFFNLTLSSLALDDKSYSVWLSRYPNLIQPTTCFFNRVTDNLSAVQQKYKLNFQKLRELGKDIIKKNETLKEEDEAVLDESNKACKRFIYESKPSVFPYIVLLFLLILAIIGAIYYYSCIAFGFQFETCQTIDQYKIYYAAKLIN